MKKIIMFFMLTLTMSCTQDKLPEELLVGSQWVCNMTPQKVYQERLFAKIEFLSTENVIYSESADDGETFKIKWIAKFYLSNQVINIELVNIPSESITILSGNIYDNEMFINIQGVNYKFLKQR